MPIDDFFKQFHRLRNLAGSEFSLGLGQQRNWRSHVFPLFLAVQKCNRIGAAPTFLRGGTLAVTVRAPAVVVAMLNPAPHAVTRTR
jgi:hypothetical protein